MIIVVFISSSSLLPSSLLLRHLQYLGGPHPSLVSRMGQAGGSSFLPSCPRPTREAGAGSRAEIQASRPDSGWISNYQHYGSPPTPQRRLRSQADHTCPHTPTCTLALEARSCVGQAALSLTLWAQNSEPINPALDPEL